MAFIGIIFVMIILILSIIGVISLTIGVILIIRFIIHKKSKRYYLAPMILIMVSIFMFAPLASIITVNVITEKNRNKEYGILYYNAINNNWDEVITLVEDGEAPDGIYHITPLM